MTCLQRDLLLDLLLSCLFVVANFKLGVGGGHDPPRSYHHSASNVIHVQSLVTKQWPINNISTGIYTHTYIITLCIYIYIAC